MPQCMTNDPLEDGQAALVRLPNGYEACNNKGRILGYSVLKPEQVDALEARLLAKGYVLLRDIVIY